MKEYLREYESIFSDCKVNKVYMPLLHTESMYFQSLNGFKNSTVANDVKNKNRLKSNSLNRFSNENSNISNTNSKRNEDHNSLLGNNNMSSTITGKSIVIDLNTDVYFTQSNLHFYLSTKYKATSIRL